MEEHFYWTTCSSSQDNSPDCTTLLAPLLFRPAEDQQDSLDRFPVVFFVACPHPCGHPACMGSTWDPSCAGREVVTTCCTECWVWKTWDFHQGELVSGLVITQGIVKHTDLSVMTLSLQSAESSFTLVRFFYIHRNNSHFHRNQWVYQHSILTLGWAFRCPVFLSLCQEKTIHSHHQQESIDLHVAMLSIFSTKNLLLERWKQVIRFE